MTQTIPNPYPELSQLVYTPEEAAGFLRVSRKTVGVLIREGRLVAQHAGVRVLVPRASLISFIEAGQK